LNNAIRLFGLDHRDRAFQCAMHARAVRAGSAAPRPDPACTARRRAVLFGLSPADGATYTSSEMVTVTVT